MYLLNIMIFQTKLLEERKIVNNGFLGEVEYLEDKELNEDDIDLLENVKKIYFCPEFNKSIDNLPDNLTEIHLNTLIELNKLPKKLKVFEFNYIEKINNKCFLNTNLKKLIFSETKNVGIYRKYDISEEYIKMINNIFTNNLSFTLEEIIFNFKFNKKFNKFNNLPVNLKNIKCLMNINTNYLPNKLLEIEIEGDYKNTFFLPSSLKKLSGCFSTNLPNKLKDITCYCFPNKIKIPKNALIVKLNIKHNNKKIININIRGKYEKLFVNFNYEDNFENVKLNLFGSSYRDVLFNKGYSGYDELNIKIINKTEKNISVEKVNFLNCDINNNFENIDIKNVIIQIDKYSKFTKYNLENMSIDNLTINDNRNIYYPYIIPINIKNIIIKSNDIQTDIDITKQYVQLNNISEIFKYGKILKMCSFENKSNINISEINTMNRTFSKCIDKEIYKCKHYCNERYINKIKNYDQSSNICFNEVELNKSKNIMFGYIDILSFIDIKVENNITIIETKEEEFKEYLLYLIEDAKKIKNRVTNNFYINKKYTTCEILYLMINIKYYFTDKKIYNITKSYKKNNIIKKEYKKYVDIVEKYCNKEFELMESEQFSVKLCVE